MSAKKSRTKKRASQRASESRTSVSAAEAGARLAWAVPQVAPPNSVKAALLARIAAESAGDLSKTGWRFSTLASEEGWVPLPFPGVRMREVTVDAERDTALLYVEMKPRAVFPDHVHSAKERGLVISGDLEMAGRRLEAGDFYEADAGTRHERIASPSGCTGLLWVSAAAWRAWRAAMAGGAKR